MFSAHPSSATRTRASDSTSLALFFFPLTLYCNTCLLSISPVPSAYILLSGTLPEALMSAISCFWFYWWSRSSAFGFYIWPSWILLMKKKVTQVVTWKYERGKIHKKTEWVKEKEEKIEKNKSVYETCKWYLWKKKKSICRSNGHSKPQAPYIFSLMLFMVSKTRGGRKKLKRK